MRFFTVEKIERLLRDVRASVTRGSADIPRFKFRQTPFSDDAIAGAERPEYDDRGWDDFHVGGAWGGYDFTAWFRAAVPIPPQWRDRKLALRLLPGPPDGGESTAEALLYVEGRPLQAFDAWHSEAWLPPELSARGEIHIALKAWSGVLGVPERRRFETAQLVWLDEGAERLVALADTLLGTVRTLDETDLRRDMILQALNEAFLAVDFARPGSDGFYASVAGAARGLGHAVDGWREISELKPRVVALGHAHIDMAWLWRLAHTREKAARTFTTVLHLMRQYPEYRYVHSSPQLYKFLKEDYPEIFARVKERIAAGQWEITGATWVEPDTNLTGGESLVRQFLFGSRWVRQEFGVEMRLLWLPDVFGYSAALPQIIAKSGVRYFLTSKISWSQFNRFPHDTFRWRGLDGTEVLTHFLTTPEAGTSMFTYNSQMRPVDVKGTWDSYRQRDVNDELLILFGWGDGGGGPTQTMLELATAGRNLPGLPYVELGQAEPFFERLAARVAGKDLPVWDGELYLEYHRGTYTSQARTKRANRLAEIAYHNAEWLSALADVLTGRSDYPLAALNEGWERILLNQFHDILPGSSIRQVYEDAARDYEHVTAIAQRAIERGQRAIAERLAAGRPATGETSLLVFNPVSWPRDGVVAVPAEQAASLRLSESPRAQRVQDEDGPRWLVTVRDVPALGYGVYGGDAFTSPLPAIPGDEITVTPTVVENRFHRMELNEHGQITSLVDKRFGREVLAPGSRGNVFQAFEDMPMQYDAWDIDIYYGEKQAEIVDLIESTVEETGPVRGSLRLRWRFRDSTITQRITLHAESPRIDFRTEIDWHEVQTLLKVAFPVAVRATRATYDIQFGSIERPAHWNTSWDWARFEVPAQKWVDLSEGDYGVALLNDCKYGHDIHDNVMRLTLIKSAISPDATADQGRHVFTYSLLPHAGDWRAGGVVHEAYALNYPLLPAPLDCGPKLLPWGDRAGELSDRCSLAEVSAGNVIVETVKRSEDDPEAWVFRVYEFEQSRRHRVRLSFCHPVRHAVESNLVEREERPVDFDPGGITFDILPFEIKTFMVWFA